MAEYAYDEEEAYGVHPDAVPPPPMTGGGVEAEAPLPVVPVGGDSTRRIIKDAAMAIEVDSIELGLSRIDGIAAQSAGYVVETSTDFSNPFRKRAFIKFAVPVGQFETALQRVREAAGEVLSEQASGVDVSQEYTDVQSQIANLEATQARVREFLEQAQTVEEALEVNAELTRIEGQLSQLKGRLQYLEQRSAFSTIAVQMQEPEPDPTITPTPTGTPTPMPTPTPTPRPPWQPGRTASQALSTLTTTLQLLGNLVIWVILALLPILVIVALPIAILWLALRAVRQRRK